MKRSSVSRWLLCSALFATTAWAQLPAGAMATVNGVALSQATFDKLVQANIAQGQKDSPQLRQAIKTEMIARELLQQESKRRELDKREVAQEAWAALQQNFQIDLLVSDHLSQNPITEAELKAEYQRQVGLLKDAEQYQLRQIVLPTESAAKDVMASLKKGQDFSRLAREKSIDLSKERGGELGWLMSTDIVPPVARAIASLKKGSVVTAPVEVEGRWHVVQMQDRRPFQPPKLEESLPQLRQALVQQKRIQLLEQLAKAANIQQ